MKQIIAFLVFWISFLSCQSEEINIYTQHVKEVSKNKDGWNLVWSEEFEQESDIPNTKIWSLATKEVSPWNRYMSESYDQAYVKDGKLYLMAEKKDGEYKTGGVWTMDKWGSNTGSWRSAPSSPVFKVDGLLSGSCRKNGNIHRLATVTPVRSISWNKLVWIRLPNIRCIRIIHWI